MGLLFPGRDAVLQERTGRRLIEPQGDGRKNGERRTDDAMDNKSKTGKPDRDRINVHEEYELRDWSAKFHVTPEELKRAVGKVGVMVEDVKRELKK